MGVYISMEMPKKSGQYVLYLDVYGDPPAAPPAVYMADCVRYFVFEVPEPHGRLIDADALKDKWAHKDLDLFSQGWGWLRDLNQAPTIIPADDMDTDAPTREEGE